VTKSVEKVIAFGTTRSGVTVPAARITTLNATSATPGTYPAGSKQLYYEYVKASFLLQPVEQAVS